MPDSLIFESPAHPSVSTAGPASRPVPFDATDMLVRLYREAQAAEAALNASEEEPDDAPGQNYDAARDRFIDARVNTPGDILLKLEQYASIEDLESESHLAGNRILLNLLRDLRATDAAHRKLSAIEDARRPPALAFASVAEETDTAAFDPLAVHAAADEQVDEIYGLLARMDGGLLALREIGESVCAGPDNWNKLRFVIDGLSDIADDLLTANDAITNAIDPLNPTVLDDGPAT